MHVGSPAARARGARRADSRRARGSLRDEVARRDRRVRRRCARRARRTASSEMFATTTSRRAAGARRRRRAARRPRRRSRARSRASPRSTALRRRRRAPASKPSSAAATESTPEPQPTSSSEPGSSSCSSSRQSCVVGCAPVPNARPGSMTTASASRRRLHPRRADPEAADADRPVEARQRSSQPASTSAPCAAAEEVPEALLAGCVGVGGELDARRSARPPRTPPGKSSIIVARASSARSCPTCTETRRRPPLSGTRSSASRRSSRRAGRCPRRSLRSNSSSRRRCSSVRRRGTETLTSTRWSPRPKPCSTGMPLPRSTRDVAGLHAGRRARARSSPSSVSTVHRRAERRLRRSSGRPASRCRCPRARSADRA